MKVLKYLFVIIIATPLQSYRRYIIIEEDNGSLEKHHIRKENKYDEYAMLLTQRFARIPMQSPAQVKLKRKQVDKFESKVRNFSLLLTGCVLIFTKLILYLPVVNYKDKSQFLEADGKTINTKVAHFILTMGVLFFIIQFLRVINIFKTLISKSYWFNIIFNSLSLMINLTFYVSIIKCLITFFKS